MDISPLARIPSLVKEKLANILNVADLSSLMQCSKGCLSIATHASDVHVSGVMFKVVPKKSSRAAQDATARVDRFLSRFEKIDVLTITAPSKCHVSLSPVLLHAPRVKHLYISGNEATDGVIHIGRDVSKLGSLNDLTRLCLEMVDFKGKEFGQAISALKMMKCLHVKNCQVQMKNSCTLTSEHIVDMQITGTYMDELILQCKILPSVLIDCINILDITACPILHHADINVSCVMGASHLTHVVLRQWQDDDNVSDAFPVIESLTLEIEDDDSAIEVSNMAHLAVLRCVESEASVAFDTCPMLVKIIIEGPDGVIVKQRTAEGVWSTM